MIRIKGRANILHSLRSAQVIAAKTQLAEKVSRGEGIRSGDFHSEYWKSEDVKNALYDSQHGKCCFCENIRSPSREFDAEHFRPKAGIYEEPEHPGYWWLAYEWSNLLYACKPCNEKYKKNQFPISGTRADGPDGNLDIEKPMLINPINENPEDFITFDWWQAYGKLVKACASEPRGSRTIEIVGLNRYELMEERGSIVLALQATADIMKKAQLDGINDLATKTANNIRDMTSSKKRFAAFGRAFFRAQGLGDYVADD